MQTVVHWVFKDGGLNLGIVCLSMYVCKDIDIDTDIDVDIDIDTEKEIGIYYVFPAKLFLLGSPTILRRPDKSKGKSFNPNTCWAEDVGFWV